MPIKKERLQKWLAKTGLMSRRTAETNIQNGRIKVNGQTIEKMGVLIDPAVDQVLFDDKPVNIKDEKVWIALYKPRQYVTTKSDPEGRNTIMDLLPNYTFTHPVGRLDYESEGLLLLTNDGEHTYSLTHPKFNVSKKYEVTILGTLDTAVHNSLINGVRLKDGQGVFKSIKVIQKDKKKSLLEIIVTEGRNRFIRKMLAHFNIEVKKLKRIEMGPIHIKQLKPKEFRLLTKSEIEKIRAISKK